MSLRGKGMLVVFTSVQSRHESDFNEWYNREHIDERVNLTGFRRARRSVAVKGDPKYFATYECGTVANLARPGYLKLLANQTKWSQRVMQRFTKFQRLTLKIRADLAHGSGGAVTCVRFIPDPKKTRALLAWLKRFGLPLAISEPGLVGGFAAENDLAVANAPARAQGLDYPEVSAVEWVVVLEGGDAAATSAAARKHLGGGALKPFGVRKPPVFGTYRLMFGNER
jgi:hypothetical protein